MSKKLTALFNRHQGPLRILALALLVTLACWQVTLDREQAQQQAFVRTTQMYRQMLAHRIEAYVNFLTDLSGLFTANDDGAVSSLAFTSFVRNAHVIKNYPGTDRIGYLPRVTSEQKARYEAQMHNAGFPDYRIRADGLPVYYPYTYLYPLDNRVRHALLGADPHLQPERDAAMQQARDLNAVIATRKLTHLVFPSTQSSFLFYAPIYRGDLPRQTAAQRRRALKGYVFAAFRADQLLHSAWGNDLSRFASVRFYDGANAATETLLYDSNARKGAGQACRHCLSHDEIIQAAGRQWRLQFCAAPAFYQGGQVLPWFVLAGGLVISLLLTGIAVQRNAKHLLARQQQAQDQQFRSLFDQNPDAVYSLSPDGHFINANAATLALTGMSLEALKTTTFRQVIVPEDLAAAQARFSWRPGAPPGSANWRLLIHPASAGIWRRRACLS